MGLRQDFFANKCLDLPSSGETEPLVLSRGNLFCVVQGKDPLSEKCRNVRQTGGGPGKVESTRTCLEAHQTLMNVNPANIPKFKDVTKFMAEDLKRLEAQKS